MRLDRGRASDWRQRSTNWTTSYRLDSWSGPVSPLSNLTEGIHLHTISCPDETAFQRVQTALERLGVLLEA